MPRRKLTLSEAKNSSSLKTNRGRFADRTDPPAMPGIGYAPKTLSPEERALWREITQLAPSGLLTAADKYAVELVCRLIHRSRTSVLKASDLNVLKDLLAKLGLLAGERSKLSYTAPQQEEVNPFDEF